MGANCDLSHIGSLTTEKCNLMRFKDLRTKESQILNCHQKNNTMIQWSVTHEINNFCLLHLYLNLVSEKLWLKSKKA